MLKKKSLGQHFLTSTHYLELIVDSAQLAAGERVLEVGPGEGSLTSFMLSRGAQVTAVEKDHRLIPLLQEKFANEIATGQLELIEDDALHFDISKYANGSVRETKFPAYKVVANIPYYITGALLRKFLSEAKLPSLMVLLVQKEVAERIARSKKESILSLSVKAYGAPKYIKTVPAGAFSPPPEVDSAILLIENISRENFTAKTLSDKVRPRATEDHRASPTPQEAAFRETRFFELVKAGFAQKRKKLASNLKPLLGEDCARILQNTGISENARAEDVALEKWLLLSQKS